MGWQYNAGRFGWKKKVEQTPGIDIRHYARRGCLIPGRRFSLDGYHAKGRALTVGGIAVMDVHSLAVISIFEGRCGFRQVRQAQIKLTYTTCNFGGRRIWFVCPRCLKRSAFMYAEADKWACRVCLQLTYTSQCEGQSNRLQRLQMKAEQKYNKFCTRKGTHKKTRDRLWEKFVKADMAWEDHFIIQSAKLADC